MRSLSDLRILATRLAKDISRSVLPKRCFVTTLIAVVAAFGMLQTGLHLHENSDSVATTLADTGLYFPIEW